MRVTINPRGPMGPKGDPGTDGEGEGDSGPLDANLEAIAALSPVNNDIIQRKSAEWTNRTPAQLKADLALAKADVGLGNVDNTADTSKPISTAQAAAIATKQDASANLGAIAALTPANDDVLQRKAGSWFSRTIAQLKSDFGLTKSDVGLSNVDNTTDLTKPVSTATQTALDLKANASALTDKADLVAGKVPTSQIPAISIGETFTVASQAAMLALTAQLGDVAIRTDESSGKYLLLGTDPTVLGNWKSMETTGGGVTSVNTQTGTVVLAKGDLGLGNVDNTADTAKPVSTAQQNAIDAVGRTDENIQDLVGAMVSGNVETGIAATYDDTNGKLDLIVSGGTDTSGWWGDGSDGAAVLDGTNTVTWASKSGNTYTMTRDVALTTLDISSGVTLITDGYRLFATQTITNAGTIHNNGVSASGGGAVGGVGGGAGTASNTGIGGASGSLTVGSNGTVATHSLGGSGGAGGAGTSGAGGTGSVATAPLATFHSVRTLPFFLQGASLSTTSFTRFTGGGGGGGGGGDGSTTGGGGGGGGGCVIIACPTITNTGVISANGGNGGTRTTGNGGGGGPGGGGCVRVLTKTAVTGTVTANAGTPGNGIGTGSAATAGSAGAVMQYIVN